MSDKSMSGPNGDQPPARLRAVDEAMRAVLIEELSPRLRGKLIQPGEPAYEERRAVWNAMVDKRPGLIAYCASTADVVAAVDAARRHRVDFSVRGGGHSVSGSALCDGGLTIDLGGMREVGVDPARRAVEADGGCLLADLDRATAPHGLVIPSGTVSTTGLGGLALGGGFGWLSRRFGLTCDNFRYLDVVLADGTVVRASSTSHPDLFWALRGGGGNYGVVTRFGLRAHPFGPNIRVGAALYRPRDAGAALREYARRLPEVSATVGWNVSLKRRMPPYPFVPPELVGERMMMLIAMWLGDDESPEGKREIERLNSTGHPCVTTTEVLPFAEGVQKMLDDEFRVGRRCYTKELHLGDLTDEAVDALLRFWAHMRMDGETALIHTGGAIGDVPEGASAFGNRRSPLWMVLDTHWSEAAQDAGNIGQLRRVADAVAATTETNAYVNMLNPDEADRVVEALGGEANHRALGRVKARYDPANLFRSNWNIVPLHDG
ncbi:FAD-binding oxidoreductase [Streptomyces sp. NPDC000134]|uniref:FAD-binding oxidoreductase n=1 Tax=Streptomyces sp. NPDC000134 TaxID=3364536 RepID=UPI0036CAEF7D